MPTTAPRRPGAFLAAALLAAGLCVTVSCQKAPENPTPEKLAPVKAGPGETAASLPKKEAQTIKVKVKRDKDGSYSWEITGKDVGQILQADRRLRNSLTDRVEKTKDK